MLNINALFLLTVVQVHAEDAADSVAASMFHRAFRRDLSPSGVDLEITTLGKAGHVGHSIRRSFAQPLSVPYAHVRPALHAPSLRGTFARSAAPDNSLKDTVDKMTSNPDMA